MVNAIQMRSCRDSYLKNNAPGKKLPEAGHQYLVPLLLPVTDNLLFLNQRKREKFP